jgi:2-polyprenyl-3-methyl-5-hydroxy-6-metoxy-1,4-benzoquinol methylase
MEVSAMPICLACQSPDVALWAEASDEEYCTSTERFNYVCCAACGALSIDPVPRTQLNTIYPANYYSFDGAVTTSPIFKVKDWLDRRFFGRFVRELPQATIAVLDVGGGSGAQLSSFRRVDARIAHTAIVDLNESARDAARARGHDYFCGRFEDYATDRKFEVILMLNLIEHVDDPRALLEKARSMLAPDGIVIIKTPNTASLDARLFRFKNWGGYHCPRHWVLFNRENLLRLLQASGLGIQHFQYTQGASFWATSVLFALARKNWIRISRERPAPMHPLFGPLSAAFAVFDLARGLFSTTSQMFLIVRRA